MAVVPVGIRILVDEDRNVYVSIGNTTAEIRERLGWTQQNVWMPEHVEQYILRKHGVFSDPIAIAHAVLSTPTSVHLDSYEEDQFYFVVGRDRLIEQGFALSDGISMVDAMVELRQVQDTELLRFFHLSPRDRNRGGLQLWP